MMDVFKREDLIHRFVDKIIDESDTEHLLRLAKSAMIIVYREKSDRELLDYIRTVAPGMIEQLNCEDDDE